MKKKKCDNFGLWLKREDTGRTVICRIRCKKWSCEYCSELNADMWRSRLRYGLKLTPGTWQFITYTAHRKWRGTEASYKNISTNSKKLWQRLRYLIKKNGCESMVYARIFELHKDGSVHVHGFVRAPMGIYPTTRSKLRENRTREDQNGIDWLSDASAACGMGWAVDCSELRDRTKAIRYVTKYASKNVFDTELPRGARRIVTSQNFPKPDWMDRDSSGEWEVIKNGIPTDLLFRAIAHGNEIYDLNIGKVINYDDLADAGDYYR